MGAAETVPSLTLRVFYVWGRIHPAAGFNRPLTIEQRRAA